MGRINLNIFDCPLYKLQLNQKNELSINTFENNVLLNDLNNMNFGKERESEKIIETVNGNCDLIDKQNKEISSFRHCEKCLLLGDKNER